MEQLPKTAAETLRPSTGRLPIWLGALLSQLIGAFAGFAAYVASIQNNAMTLEVFHAALVGGGVAALLGHKVFRMPVWWLVINAAFLPCIVVVRGGEWPTWMFGVLFVLTLLVFWNVVRDRVPLYLSNETTVIAVASAMEELKPEALEPAPKKIGEQPPAVGRFCDLGSGTGGLASAIAVACPRWQIVGYENAPILWLFSVLRGSFTPRRLLTFQRRNFWSQSLETFDVVYAFLSPEPMAKLFEKVKSEMKPGSVFISNSFEVPGETPDEVRTLDDRRQTRLLIWRL